MPEYVMVRDKSTGAHYPLIKSAAESDPDAYQVLKESPLNENGDPKSGYMPEPTTAPKAAKKTVAKRPAANKTAAAKPVPEKTEES